jgi:uncharacterized protein YndB with AHSA1/START domain
MIGSTKTKFVREYPINASAKLLYPYLSTASGLAQWFCDDVNISPDKTYNFLWDGRNHFAELTNLRSNRSVRFLFVDKAGEHPEDPSYIDFTIEFSELTQELFLKVIDYSEEADVEEQEELWDNLMQHLREIVGG